MKAVVLLKQVPDTWGERKLDLESGLADRARSEVVVDEIGERALEVALQYSDGDPSSEIVVVTMGPEKAAEALKKGLSMGASSAIHILDERLIGADLTVTSEVLAAAIAKISPDIVITGSLSTDGSGGVLPAMIAEHLGISNLTGLTAVTFDSNTVSGDRASDGATMRLQAQLPAVVSITEQLPDPRFPNFKGIMAAKKKPFETWSLDDLGIKLDDQTTSRSIVTSVAKRPAREAGKKVVDDGTGAQQLVDFLAAQRLI